MIEVTGKVQFGDEKDKRFTQSFFVRAGANGTALILGDCFRFIWFFFLHLLHLLHPLLRLLASYIYVFSSLLLLSWFLVFVENNWTCKHKTQNTKTHTNENREIWTTTISQVLCCEQGKISLETERLAGTWQNWSERSSFILTVRKTFFSPLFPFWNTESVGVSHTTSTIPLSFPKRQPLA